MLGDLIIAQERLTTVGKSIATVDAPEIIFAKLDESSETPQDVAVKEFPKKGTAWPQLAKTAAIVTKLRVWRYFNHRNVLELLGCFLNPSGEIYRLISPRVTHGNIRQYLAQAPVTIAPRLGFVSVILSISLRKGFMLLPEVRDVAAGLEYLHSHIPPICHGNLNTVNILVDGNLNAVLGGFEPLELYDERWTSFENPRYMSPEFLLGESYVCDLPSDVWSWGCCAFEILTDEQPFNQHERSGEIFYSMINRRAPGRPEMLLDLVPNAPKPEYASTLRLLHSYLPLCWEYKSLKRPQISLLHRQIFMFCFIEDAGDSVVTALEELAHLLIPPDRLRILDGSELGAGNYGEVVLGTLDPASSTARDVAVKRLKAIGARGERIRLAKRLARELNVWARVRHPNVVELLGYYLNDKCGSPLLISALMPNGNILEYIERFKPGIKQRVSFVRGITAGLACLHSFDPPICHGDLKPANVLIDLCMNAVLCDFGLASFISGLEASPGLATSTTIKGTARYMSSELLLGAKDCKHSLESDIWAWACTTFQVLTGSFPYPEAPGEPQICMAMVKEQSPCDVNLLLPNNFEETDSEPALALQFLHSTLPQCWDFEPQRRPSMHFLHSQISDPSSEKGAASSGHDGVGFNGSSEGTTISEASQNPSEEPVNHAEGVQGASPGVPTGPPPENLSKRKRGSSCLSEDADDNDDGRRVRPRVEGSLGGGMRNEEDKERQCGTLKEQLLALVAAIDEDSEMREGQAGPENPIWIRKALGDKWESQLATVLQDIDRRKRSGAITDMSRNADEGKASQRTVGSRLRAPRTSSSRVAEDPDARMAES